MAARTGFEVNRIDPARGNAVAELSGQRSRPDPGRCILAFVPQPRSRRSGSRHRLRTRRGDPEPARARSGSMRSSETIFDDRPTSPAAGRLCINWRDTAIWGIAASQFLAALGHPAAAGRSTTGAGQRRGPPPQTATIAIWRQMQRRGTSRWRCPHVANGAGPVRWARFSLMLLTPAVRVDRGGGGTRGSGYGWNASEQLIAFGWSPRAGGTGRSRNEHPET